MRIGDPFLSLVINYNSRPPIGQPKTDRIDNNTAAGIFVTRMARRYVEYIRC